MSIYDTLNEQQKLGVMTTEGPVLILAGAGSGKTRVLTHRTAYLIEEKGVNPYNIMAITFTNKAAGEMRERINALVGYGSESIWVSTFHSTCVRILRRHIDRIGYDTNFTIYDSDDSKSVMKEICKRLNIDTKIYKERSLLAAISSAKDELVSPTQFALQASASSDFAKKKQAQVYQEYQAALQKNNALDFDDLIVKTVELLQTDPEVLAYYQERFRYIMVDEYQDTNALQDSIIKKIRKDNQNLMVVGDDMQSIYKFRGADVQNILSFPKRYTNCKVIYLTENYRSSQEILNLANHVMTNATEGYQKNLRAQFSSQELPKVYGVNDTKTEAEFVLNRIKAKHAEGIPYNDICVLYRNSFQSYELEVLLNKAGLDFEKYGGIRFLDRAHIKDVLAFLRIYTNPSDELAWFRILQLHIGIGKVYARNISRKCLEYGPEYLIDDCHKRKKYGVHIRKLYDEIQSWEGKEFLEILKSSCAYYAKTLENAIRNKKVDSESDREESLQDLEKNKEDIAILQEMAKDYDSALAFLDATTLDAAKSKENEEDKLVLSTIHSVKGLEYDTVILLDCIDEILPSARYIGSPEDNEDVRCMYVAVTRAKNTLYMMVPKIALKYGKAIPGDLSRYIEGRDDLYDAYEIKYQS